MTNEEAIAVLEELQCHCSCESESNAYDLAISALQSVGKDITVHNKDDNFREVTKMIPLTIEELRKMDGQPVLLVFDFELDPMTALAEYAEAADCIILTNNLGGRSEFYSDEELKESGIKVYAYPPAHIDLEAWKKCDCCTGCQNCIFSNNSAGGRPCKECLESGNDKNFQPIGYCKYCGRPLTEEAWAELEKRLRG